MRNLYNFARECPSTVKDYKEKFRCTICDSNISLAHSGQGDIEKHKETKAHKDNVKSVERTLNFFHRPTQESDLPPSIAAEVACSMMLVQHNTFMNISDHLTPIINKHFKDSDAGKAYMYRRTRTAAIVNCIGDDVFENVKSSMQQGPFSLLLDASNDTGIQKMFPITVRLYDVQFN